jgi:protein-tyrosine-phosphatase
MAAADRLGVDLSRHRSLRLTDAHVRDADAVFVFDNENYDRMAADHGCRAKLHFIGALCPEGPLYIDDPYGHDVERFEQTYELIRTAVLAAYPCETPSPAVAAC